MFLTLSGSGVSVIGGATMGGHGGCDLCAQPAHKISVIAAAGSQASLFLVPDMFSLLLTSSVFGRGRGKGLRVLQSLLGALGTLVGYLRFSMGQRGP